MTAEDHQRRRHRMVERDLRGRGIVDERVLEVMAEVPRERFVPDHLADHAYDDGPLPIGAGQTISQPYIVALMAEAAALSPTDRVLEVGTGSGYGAAVLDGLAAEVISIERQPTLIPAAHRSLDAAGADNVTVIEGDGSVGRPDDGPFDAIVVTASAPVIPDVLVDQLAEGGRLVIPVGPEGGTQELVRVTRRGDRVETAELCPVRFVPLLGEAGQRNG